MTTTWSTGDELGFVRGLGYHLSHIAYPNENRLQQPDRLELLRMYRASIRGRARWGDIDARAVAELVDAEIDGELVSRKGAA